MKLAAIGTNIDHLQVTLMQECEVGKPRQIIQIESFLRDVGRTKDYVVLIGQELLVPEWEKKNEI